TIVAVEETNELNLGGLKMIPFSLKDSIHFNNDYLPFHSNGMRFTATLNKGERISEIYYSIGGGFIVQEKNDQQAVEILNDKKYPYPIAKATELAEYCKKTGWDISSLVFENEKVLRSEDEINFELKRVWDTML